MAGPWKTDEQLGLNAKQDYILKHYPAAEPTFMEEAGRWVILARGSYNELITIGTGSTERAAWQSAYKYTQENVSPLSQSVSTPKISTESSSGILKMTAVLNPNTNLWTPLEELTNAMPVGWHSERVYSEGEVVYMRDGSQKVYHKGNLHDTDGPFNLPKKELTGAVVESADTKTLKGIEQLKEAQASGALAKLKSGIEKKLNLHVGQYVPVDDEKDVQILTAAKLKPIPIDKYKVKFTPTMKPMMLPKKPSFEEAEDEDFAPIVKKKPYSSVGYKADLTNQVLVQHIGVASNCNVILQQAFSTKGKFGRKIRVVCKECNKDKVYFDEDVFHMTPDGSIHNELKEFCYGHRHDGGKVEMPWKTVAVPDPAKTQNFRRFRED